NKLCVIKSRQVVTRVSGTVLKESDQTVHERIHRQGSRRIQNHALEQSARCIEQVWKAGNIDVPKAAKPREKAPEFRNVRKIAICRVAPHRYNKSVAASRYQGRPSMQISAICLQRTCRSTAFPSIDIV